MGLVKDRSFKKRIETEPVFAGRKKFLPKHSDLSFYNWDTNYSTSNSTPNYQVMSEYYQGSIVVGTI